MNPVCQEMGQKKVVQGLAPVSRVWPRCAGSGPGVQGLALKFIEFYFDVTVIIGINVFIFEVEVLTYCGKVIPELGGIL